MANLEALGKELERRGKTGDLKRLAESADGQRLGQMIDARAVEQAARSGDAAALSALLRSVLSTEEGRRLARQAENLLK